MKPKYRDDINSKKYSSANAKSEPLKYESVFYVSINTKLLLFGFGIVFILLAIFIISKNSIFFPLFILCFGIVLSAYGIKELLDKEPYLKLAKEGLWTRKLGFKPWNNIRMTKMMEDKYGRGRQSYLEIYLFDSRLSYPDERLSVTNLQNKKKIQPLILKLYRK